MKCNKCAYTSFDHNQNCPKCNYDLVAQATKMNLPSYQASPPYLLASLLGGKDEYISVAPSHDPDSQPERDTGISMLDDIELPYRTILPGLAEAVAELAKKEEEGHEAVKTSDINIENLQEQEKTNESSGISPAIKEAASPQANDKQEYDEEDMFEFILDEEQPEEAELKAEQPEPAEESLEIELTMLPETDEDQKTQPSVEIIIPEEQTSQDGSLNNLIELTEVEDNLQKQEKPKEPPKISPAIKINVNRLNPPPAKVAATAPEPAPTEAAGKKKHDNEDQFEFMLDKE